MTHPCPAPLVELRHLSKSYQVGKRHIQAVSDLSLSIHKATTLGLVGESGCGKTTTGRCLLRLEDASSGEAYYEGRPLFQFKPKELFAFRRQAQLIFQDPYSSLNPRMSAAQIIAEPLKIHEHFDPVALNNRVLELADHVGLSAGSLKRFPHEFSGGQRQRIGIARALALNPQFIVCDEPISALDVPIQAQIINLLKQLQQELGLTYLFITHNLAMVRYISDQIAVMYLGHLVEMCDAQELYRTPLHPYTQTLLAAIPPLTPSRKRLPMVDQEPHTLGAVPIGCPFANRCPHAMDRCHQQRPPLITLAPGHQVACHLYPAS